MQQSYLWVQAESLIGWVPTGERRWSGHPGRADRPHSQQPAGSSSFAASACPSHLDRIPELHWHGCLRLPPHRCCLRPHHHLSDFCRAAHTTARLLSVLHPSCRGALGGPLPCRDPGVCHLWVLQCAGQDHCRGVGRVGPHPACCPQLPAGRQEQALSGCGCLSPLPGPTHHSRVR